MVVVIIVMLPPPLRPSTADQIVIWMEQVFVLEKYEDSLKIILLLILIIKEIITYSYSKTHETHYTLEKLFLHFSSLLGQTFVDDYKDLYIIR